MIGFRKKAEHPGAIRISDNSELGAGAFELARFWVNPDEGRSYVLVGMLDKWRPELLGSLLTESVCTAAQAYAAVGQISEDEALRRIWQGFDEERARLSAEPAKEDN
ncbi:DUF5076 domain-containing protein [Sphingobium sp. 10 DY56-G10]|uniref:DUF5076 domain-containing protein n=1 Tax=Sphingomonadales TaxID=204457 RepID=UPI0000D7ACE5|nr:DUF5076 domain-containing protein [Sphingomonas sp. SKA58]EAT09895.1 hypothetical protein SKA58_05540 [Sphingomonas sp. SKA58]|tara:strand:+ start:190 stop:510 length:321 start_codon:yes stop_codon:yes gene_type:complete